MGARSRMMVEGVETSRSWGSLLRSARSRTQKHLPARGVALILALGPSLVLALTGALGLSSAQAADLRPWRHGMVQAKSDAGIVLMADHKGFAKDQGLELSIVQFTGDTLALKALISGDIDTYEGSPGGPMLAASHGADIKIVGCYWPGLTYGLYAKSSINSVKDLVGKTIAISGPASLPDLLTRGILQNAGVSAGDVRFAAMGGDADRIKAITAGVADAGAASLEFVHFATGQGLKLLVNAHDAVPKFVRLCTYASSKTVTSRKEELAHFLAAQMQGAQYAIGHRDETLALTRATTHVDEKDSRAGDLFDQVIQYNAVDPSMPIPVERLAWMQELLIKTGNLKAPYDLTQLVDDGARQKALTLVHR